MRIRLTEPGFEKYTGPIGEFDFVDGISVDEMGRHSSDRFGAVMRCESVSGEVIGAAQRLAKLVETPMPQNVLETPQAAPAIEPSPASPIYTVEQLGAIADSEGLEGLRKIGDPLGLKGRAIRDLMEAILNKQSEARAAQAKE